MNLLAKFSKYNILNLLFFIIAYAIIFLVEYNSVQVIVYIFLFTGIILAFINRQAGLLFYIITIFIFDDIPYDLNLTEQFTSIDTLTIAGQTATKIWTLVWILLIFTDFVRKKRYLPKDSVRFTFFVLLFISFFTGVLYGNLIYLGPFVNDLRFFINFFVGYLGVILYLNKSENIYQFLQLLSLIFIAKLVILLILTISISKTTVLYSVSGDTGLYLASVFLLLYFSFYRRHSKIIVIIGMIVTILVLGISASRGRIVILFFHFALFLFATGNIKKALVFLILLVIPFIIIPFISPEMYNYLWWKITSFNPSTEGGQSAMVRYVEFQNIIAQNLESIYEFIFGRGLGGHWDSSRYPYPFNLYGTSSYPDEWIRKDMFFKPHGIIQFSLLKFGFIGFSLLYFVIYKQFFKVKKTFILYKQENIMYNKNLINLLIILAGSLCILILVAYSSKLQLFFGIFAGIIAVLKKTLNEKKTS